MERSEKPIIVLVAGIIFLLALVVLPFFLIDREEAPTIDNRGDWVAYTSEAFGFSVEHPPEWEVVDLLGDSFVPRVHIVPSGTDLERYDVVNHHTDVPNVSVFPEGFPTDGVEGQSRNSRVLFGEAMREKTDFYVGEDGPAWGTFALPEELPNSWTESGFIWARTHVEGHGVLCRDDGEEIDMNRCDPVVGHEIHHIGSVDRSERRIQEGILQSFRFIQ